MSIYKSKIKQKCIIFLSILLLVTKANIFLSLIYSNKLYWVNKMSDMFKLMVILCKIVEVAQ